MEVPDPSENHHRLATFVGTWSGEETLHAGPGSRTRARGSFEYRMDIGGFFLIGDYAQERDGRSSYCGHGVFGWDEDRACYTMHWFDNSGGEVPREPTTGAFSDDSMVFVRETERGATRFVHILEARDRYVFRVESRPVGGAWTTVMEGRYRRMES